MRHKKRDSQISGQTAEKIAQQAPKNFQATTRTWETGQSSEKIRLKPDVTLVKVKARRYPPKHREFINNYISKLVDVGFFINRPTARWNAAPLLILKPGSTNKYRMTVDLRPINAATEKNSGHSQTSRRS